MNIPTNSKDESGGRIALFNLGFRIFFLSAALFSILSICLWAAVYLFQVSLPLESISPTQWHAHEMIYGYAMAAIAGFLLTAVKNWTGVQTLHGWPLALLFLLWAVARLLFTAGDSLMGIAAVCDMLFGLGFLAAVSYPIIKVRQWKQMAILSKILILCLFNLLFYLGAADILSNGVYWGMYGGLYLVISLIMTLGRRVVPFFIERGVDQPLQLYKANFIDLSSLLLFLVFTVVEVFFYQPALSAWLALALFLVNARRLVGWHTPGIWNKSLLWSLYLGFWMICIGFLLISLSHFAGVNKFLAIHAFAFGGIGMMTLGMMSRVSLGHSGRSIRDPSNLIAWAFGLLLVGAIIRIFFPMFAASQYLLWVGLSQLAWIAAFLIFSVLYLPVLSRPRIDGRPG